MGTWKKESKEILIDRRNKDINNTKIKFLNVANKIYQVTNISFFYMTIEAIETDLTIDDVPECELWDIREFAKYKIRLTNGKGLAEILDFEKLKSKYA